MATTSEDPDEWELLNIDGFLCKRKKRPRIDADVPQQAPDPALERRRRRELKRKVLSNLRDKYLQEIGQWELLSNMLKDMQQSAQRTLHERQEELVSPTSEQHSQPDSSCRRVVDDLLAQVVIQTIPAARIMHSFYLFLFLFILKRGWGM